MNLSIYNKLCTHFFFQNNYLDKYYSWAGILSATDLAVQINHRTKWQNTPVQLVFGHDMILNTHCISDLEAIGIRNQELIDKNNQNKNNKSLNYRIHEKVLVYNKK